MERSFHGLLKAKKIEANGLSQFADATCAKKTTLCRNTTAPHMKSASVIAFSNVDVSHIVVTNCIKFADILLRLYESFILMEKLIDLLICYYLLEIILI